MTKLVSNAKHLFGNVYSILSKTDGGVDDIGNEVYRECTFQPQANNAHNEKLASRKYRKDAQTLGNESRVVVLYLDGLKKDKVKPDIIQEDLKYKT